MRLNVYTVAILWHDELQMESSVQLLQPLRNLPVLTCSACLHERLSNKPCWHWHLLVYTWHERCFKLPGMFFKQKLEESTAQP